MVQAKCERAAEEEAPDVAHHDAENECQPVHPRTAPPEDKGAQEIVVEISEDWIGLQEDVSVEHTGGEDDGRDAAKAVCPLQGRVGGEERNGHGRMGKGNRENYDRTV